MCARSKHVIITGKYLKNNYIPVLTLRGIGSTIPSPKKENKTWNTLEILLQTTGKHIMQLYNVLYISHPVTMFYTYPFLFQWHSNWNLNINILQSTTSILIPSPQ